MSWNPLASLPPSNIGALAAYSPGVQQAPVVSQTPAPVMGAANPNAFQTAMQAWHGQQPPKPRFDPRSLMAAQPPGTPFDPRQARTDWVQNLFNPWQTTFDNWQAARPQRADF